MPKPSPLNETIKQILVLTESTIAIGLCNMLPGLIIIFFKTGLHHPFETSAPWRFLHPQGDPDCEEMLLFGVYIDTKGHDKA